MDPSNETLTSSLLEEMAQKDPRMHLLTQLMAQQQSTRQGNAEDGKLKAQLNKQVILNRELKDRVAQLKRHKEQLLAYLDYFIGTNAAFAGSVGACECWGEDEQCGRCLGKGRPGFFAVDQDAFAYYVSPALKQLEREAAAGAGSQAAPAPKSNSN